MTGHADLIVLCSETGYWPLECVVFIVAEERGWDFEVQLAEAAPMQGANNIAKSR